ncbi:MAG: tetratricopeptide (TPR) repeat protein [Kiritimatiellia bacterium]
MRVLLPILLTLSSPAWSKAPKSGNSVVTRASIAVDSANYDDAIKRLSGLMTDLRKGDLTLEPARHAKATYLLAVAHRARALQPQNNNPVADLVESIRAATRCTKMVDAADVEQDCRTVADDVGQRMYSQLISISVHAQDAPLSTDEIVQASDIRQALQSTEEGRIRPHLGEAWYRARVGDSKDADAAALAGLKVAQGGIADQAEDALELAQLQARVRAFNLGDVDAAVAGLSDWTDALKGAADTSTLDALARTLARSADRLQTARKLAEAETGNVDAQVTYAGLLSDMGQHKEASDWWKRATSAQPEVADLWYRRGVFHTNRAGAMQKNKASYQALRGTLQDAADAFGGCLKVEPKHATCLQYNRTIEGYLSQYE